MLQDINNKTFNNMLNGFSVPTGFIEQKKLTSVTTLPQNPSNTQNPTDTKNSSQKTKIPLGKKVLYSILAIGTLGLIFTKGLSGSTAKKLGKWADKIENDLLMKADGNKFAYYVDSGINGTSKFVKRIFSLSNAVANFTALKDNGFRKLYTLNFLRFKNPEKMKFSGLAKLWNGIVNIPKAFFDFATKSVLKITESAIDSRYSNAARNIDRGIAKGVKLLEGSKASAAQKAEVEGLLNNLNTIFTNGFSKTSRNARMQELEKGLSNLPDKVNDAIMSPFSVFSFKLKLPFKQRIKLFFRRIHKNYSSYITVEQSKTARLAHQNSVTKAKIAFSNNNSDIAANLKNYANGLKHSLNKKDYDNRKLIGSILRQIEEYAVLPEGSNTKLQKEIMQNLEIILKQVNGVNAAGNKVYSIQQISEIQNIINTIKKTMNEFSSQGALQKVDEKMKNLLSPKEYKKWQEQVLNPIQTSFNNAVDAEMGNMVDKFAEAKVGSIPTDVVFQAAAIGGGAVHIAKEDDKKEKIGASLKTGLPILGGIATYFYSASKAFSGTTNLALTAISAYLLNRAGDSMFKYYHKRYIEKKPVKEIAKEAVDDATKTK